MPSKLAQLATTYGRMVKDLTYKVDVFEVDTPHTFVQALGYLKFLAAMQGKTVGYRGQRKLYSTSLVPTLFRGVKTVKTKAKRERQLNALLKRVESDREVLQAVHEAAREPLLQHYGINTRWIDLVDNVWVALWFACYRGHVIPKAPRFLHFERREPDARDENEFAYVLVLEVERGTEHATCPGRFDGSASSRINLREAVSSHFIRPHAQHGLLFSLNFAPCCSDERDRLAA